jgi:hypothetical protein
MHETLALSEHISQSLLKRSTELTFCPLRIPSAAAAWISLMLPAANGHRAQSCPAAPVPLGTLSIATIRSDERRLSVAEAQLAFAGLATLVTPEPVAGAEALSALLERHDQRRYLEQWLTARSD